MLLKYTQHKLFLPCDQSGNQNQFILHSSACTLWLTSKQGMKIFSVAHRDLGLLLFVLLIYILVVTRHCSTEHAGLIRATNVLLGSASFSSNMFVSLTP